MNCWGQLPLLDLFCALTQSFWFGFSSSSYISFLPVSNCPRNYNIALQIFNYCLPLTVNCLIVYREPSLRFDSTCSVAVKLIDSRKTTNKNTSLMYLFSIYIFISESVLELSQRLFQHFTLIRIVAHNWGLFYFESEYLQLNFFSRKLSCAFVSFDLFVTRASIFIRKKVTGFCA